MNNFLKKKKASLYDWRTFPFLCRASVRSSWLDPSQVVFSTTLNAGFTVEPSKRVKGQIVVKVSNKNPLKLLPLKAYDKNLQCAVSINVCMQREWAKCYVIRGIHLHVHTQTDDNTPADVVCASTVYVCCVHASLSLRAWLNFYRRMSLMFLSQITRFLKITSYKLTLMKVLSAYLSSRWTIFALMLCNRKSLRDLPAPGQRLTEFQDNSSRQKKTRCKGVLTTAWTLLLGRISCCS